MHEIPLQPQHRGKLHQVAEGLFDASARRIPIHTDTWSDLFDVMRVIAPSCGVMDANDVLSRLLAIADHRLGVGEIADLVLTEIALASPNPSAPFDWARPRDPS